jgi:hypothetical protein
VFAIASLLLIIALSLVVTRVATVVLVATGTARHVARFQARSALTGAGFTTSESERVVNHPVRRKVIATLMLLGNAGIVGAASTAILGFQGRAFGHAGWRVAELGVGLLALVFVSRSRWVDRKLTEVTSRVLRRHTDLPVRDLAGLLELSGDYAVQELAVAPGDWIAERTLADLGLRDEGVVVLGVTRSGGRYLGAPTGSTVLRAGDNLILYGRAPRLRELDDRKSGSAGERARTAAVEEQQEVEREQTEADTQADAT